MSPLAAGSAYTIRRAEGASAVRDPADVFAPAYYTDCPAIYLNAVNWCQEYISLPCDALFPAISGMVPFGLPITESSWSPL